MRTVKFLLRGIPFKLLIMLGVVCG